MKKKKNEKENVKKPYCSMWNNIVWVTKKQLKYAPAAFFIQLLEVPVNIGLAWAGIYLPSLVVAEAAGGRGTAHAVRTVGALMFAILCGGILKSIIGRLLNSLRLPYAVQVNHELNRKTTDCFYQTFEKKEIRDLHERAERATFMWDGVQPINDMPQFTFGLAESILCYVLFGTVVSFVSPWLLVLLTLAPAVNWFCERAYQRWEYQNRRKWMEIERRMWYVQGRTADFAVAKDIRIYGMTGWLTGIYQSLFAERAKWDRKKIARKYIPSFADLAVILVRDSAAYAILIFMALDGKITVDQFVLYFAAISSFAGWIGNILSKWNGMRFASLKLCDLREYLDLPDEDGTGEAHAEDFLDSAPEIVFDHVSFCYEGAQRDTLHDVCLTIRQGERVALVGLNGAGKTTLVKLLCGLYRPTSGEIRINGTPAGKFRRRDYYRLFSAVFQKVNTAFFTLAETVSGEAPEKTDLARAEQCMRRAGLGKKLDSLPGGILSKLDKQVNEDGVELSGGELQKLMLARALYKDAPVLVLDEPTAALDPIAESGIYEQYKDMTAGKSSLFISHRLASTRFCDRILYMKEGRIAEEGTHESLAAAGGEYAQLYELQSCWYQDGADEQ